MKRCVAATAVFGLLLASFAPPAGAIYHLAVIDQVMTSYNGHADQQFIDIRMLNVAQNFVMNSVLAAFDANGNYINDVLVVPADVANSGVGVHWLVATAAFQTGTGLTPDFIMPPGILPTGGGMVCFGGGGGVAPAAPGSWSRTIFTNYVDCVAYGSYHGPTNLHIGNPTPIAPDGHSIRRVNSTNNNDNDFVCGNPADPTSNAPNSVSLPATTPCPGPNIDHFKCYKIKKDMLATFPATVTDVDQFGTATDEIKKAFLWCNPATTNGGPILDGADHLLCYKIKGDQFEPNPHLSTTNQFGTSTLFAKKPFLLCVPGNKTIIP